MPRKSVASKAVRPPIDRRPDPPSGLTREQAALWSRIVAGEPAEIFKSAVARGMLADFVCHASTTNELSAQIRRLPAGAMIDPVQGRTYQRLLKMRADESRAAAALLTKLRLTNQSRFTPKAAATAARKAPTAGLPWDFK